MKEILVLLLCLTCTHLGYSQHTGCRITLSGTITDTQTNEPIAHAHIQIGSQAMVLSNHSGQYKISHLCEGQAILHIKHLAYNSKELAIDITKDSTVNIQLQKKTIELTAVNVKVNEGLNTNQNVTQLSKLNLAESRGGNLAEVLSEVAGVQILKTGNNISKPVVNGLFGNRLILLNNGVRHESQQWGNDHAPEIDPFISNQIQVIKNSDAVRYGADALGGIISLKQASIDPERVISGNQYSIYNSNSRSSTNHLQLEGSLDKWAYRVGGTFGKGGNYKSADYFLGNTGKQETNGNVLIQYQLSKGKAEVFLSTFNTTLGIFEGAHIGSIEDIFVRIAHGRPFEEYDFSYQINAPKQRVNHQLAKLSYTHNFSSAAQLETNYSFQRNHRKEFDYRRTQSNDIPMADIELSTQQLEVIYNKNNYKAGIIGSLQINNNIAGTGTTPIIPNFDNHSIAAFMSRKIPFHNHIAEFGIRYDYKYFDVAGYRYDYATILDDGSIRQYLLQDRKHFNNVSGIAGVNFKLDQNFRLKSNVGLAWRAPSANELYSDGIHHGTGSYEIGNINLKSEKGIKWVNGLEHKSTWFQGNVDIFGQWIGDFIYNEPQPDSVRQTIRGTFPIFEYRQHNALFYGVDLSFEISLFDDLKYQNAISIVRAKNLTLDNYLPNIPSDKLIHAFSYDYTISDNYKGYLKVQHHYQSKQTRYDAGSDFAPPPPDYHLFDVLLSNNITINNSNKFNFIVGVENVFNKSYKDYMDRFRYYAHSIGRNVSLKLHYSF